MMLQEQTSSVGKLRLLGQGAEAEVFEWRDGQVLKLLRARGATERLVYEIAALEVAHSAGLRVPRAYEQVVVDGRPGLVMERLEGTDLLSVLGEKPWLVLRSGRLMGELHARINAVPAPTSLPKVRDVMWNSLSRVARREPSEPVDWIERILGRLPDGEALCHGDFHPGQLMLWHGRSVAFDWPAAKRGDSLYDYARTRILLGMGEPPPGTRPALRLLAKVGRRLLLSAYAHSYERNTKEPVDRSRVRDWEIVNIAVRLLENIPGERPRLLLRLRKERARRERS